MKHRKFRQIITDGIALLLPILAALYLLKKLVEVFRRLVTPLAEKLGIEYFLGRFTLSIIALAAIFLIILVLGLMMEWSVVAKFRNAFENLLLRIFPPLNQLKVMLADVLDRENAVQSWKSVLLHDGEKYRFAFLVEENETMGVFFVMKSQSIHDGDIEMLKKDAYSYTEVDATRMKKTMRQFGVKANELLREKDSSARNTAEP